MPPPRWLGNPPRIDRWGGPRRILRLGSARGRGGTMAERHGHQHGAHHQHASHQQHGSHDRPYDRTMAHADWQEVWDRQVSRAAMERLWLDALDLAEGCE